MLFLHVLAAMYWVGGNLLFFVALRRASPEDRSALYRSLGRTFRWSSWVALVVLGITGGFLLQDFPAELYRTKFVLVGVAVGLKGVHDFGIAPRAARGRPGSTRVVYALAYGLLLLEMAIVYVALNP